jgi:hypothetical protein
MEARSILLPPGSENEDEEGRRCTANPKCADRGSKLGSEGPDLDALVECPVILWPVVVYSPVEVAGVGSMTGYTSGRHLFRESLCKQFTRVFSRSDCGYILINL